MEALILLFLTCKSTAMSSNVFSAAGLKRSPQGRADFAFATGIALC